MNVKSCWRTSLANQTVCLHCWHSSHFAFHLCERFRLWRLVAVSPSFGDLISRSCPSCLFNKAFWLMNMEWGVCALNLTHRKVIRFFHRLSWALLMPSDELLLVRQIHLLRLHTRKYLPNCWVIYVTQSDPRHTLFHQVWALQKHKWEISSAYFYTTSKSFIAMRLFPDQSATQSVLL